MTKTRVDTEKSSDDGDGGGSSIHDKDGELVVFLAVTAEAMLLELEVDLVDVKKEMNQGDTYI